ncbi:lecithin retinol acyltransferase family protein [Lusitaniella coriacea LEGE 07157]|uniref:Lecithin retinol acyltransferase family protein n=1 Tax=Lusitaniella coriacea LEGE 07157 TaxID=945747 RepID=A0A8J7JE14_9CYAN|nr:lecithin retinol acyltransferase family protein [Lusitaniella coriacea]MBE9118125.1 lecithin retinol acyltransferase family protein [Lusitaniella coriacea LEGE 07157]
MARGEQIYVYREFLNLRGVYEHHGIDCGDGTIIHYSKRTNPPEVQRTSIEFFTQGNSLHLRQYPSSFIADVAIHRAQSRLGERQYNLLFNNCEHFATWCKVGISESQQIREFIPAIHLIKPEDLYEPVRQAIQGTDRDNATRLFNQALADIKIVWDDIQPRYKTATEEANTWQKVAVEALKKNREDLARAALTRKQKYQKEAKSLHKQLQDLSAMTENLLRNRQNI